MSVFSERLVADAKFFLDEFGESITVLPDGETERTITAIVDYADIEPVPGLPHGHSYSMWITVANDAATGLSTAEFDAGLAKVKIPTAVGKTPTLRSIAKIISQDAGMVTYGVR